MSRTTCWPRAVILLVAVLVLVYSTQDIAAKPKKKPGGGGGTGPSYTIVPLDNMGGTVTGGVARDVNDQRQIVGQVDNPLGGYLAACWTTSEAGGNLESELHLLAGGGVANAINHLGEIVGAGEIDGQVVGLFWADTDADPLVLPFLAGDEESIATGINHDGVICGVSVRPVPRFDDNGDPMFDSHGNQIFDRGSTAVAWRCNGPDVFGPIALPTLDFSSAAAMNDNDGVGEAEIVGGFQEMVPNIGLSWSGAVVWQIRCELDGSLTVGDFESLGDARPEGVNNLGTICGWIPSPPEEAVVWDGGSWQVLERNRSVYWARAQDIAESDVIVGFGYYWKKRSEGLRAVIWPSAGGSMILLSEFLDRNSPFTTLSSAHAINQSGDIVGAGWDGNNNGAFLAIPE